MNIRLESALFATIAVILLSTCGAKDKIAKHEQAISKADFIMNGLGKIDLTDQFPKRHFPPDQLEPFLDKLTRNCDFNSKRGKFVDFFSMEDRGGSKTAVIYEYILNCDSIRFIYFFDLDGSEAELYHFEIEGIEQKNRMIIDPKKQLLYDK